MTGFSKSCPEDHPRMRRTKDILRLRFESGLGLIWLLHPARDSPAPRVPVAPFLCARRIGFVHRDSVAAKQSGRSWTDPWARAGLPQLEPARGKMSGP